jgi:hypothetical protein
VRLFVRVFTKTGSFGCRLSDSAITSTVQKKDQSCQLSKSSRTGTVRTYVRTRGVPIRRCLYHTACHGLSALSSPPRPKRAKGQMYFASPGSTRLGSLAFRMFCFRAHALCAEKLLHTTRFGVCRLHLSQLAFIQECITLVLKLHKGVIIDQHRRVRKCCVPSGSGTI